MTGPYTEIIVEIVVDAAKILQEKYSSDGVLSKTRDNILAIDDFIETNVLSKERVSVSKNENDLKFKPKHKSFAFCRRKWYKGSLNRVKQLALKTTQLKTPDSVMYGKKLKQTKRRGNKKTKRLSKFSLTSKIPSTRKACTPNQGKSHHIKVGKRSISVAKMTMCMIEHENLPPREQGSQVLCNSSYVEADDLSSEYIDKADMERCESADTTSDYEGSSSGFFSDDEMEFDDDWERTRFSKCTLSRHRKSKNVSFTETSPIKPTTAKHNNREDGQENNTNTDEIYTPKKNISLDIEIACFDVMTCILDEIDNLDILEINDKKVSINDNQRSLSANAQHELLGFDRCAPSLQHDQEKLTVKRSKISPTSKRLKSTVVKVQKPNSDARASDNLNSCKVTVLQKAESNPPPEVSDNELEPGEIVDEPEPPTVETGELHRHSRFSYRRYASKSPRRPSHFPNFRFSRTRPYSPRFRGTFRSSWPYSGVSWKQSLHWPTSRTYDPHSYTEHRTESRGDNDLRSRLGGNIAARKEENCNLGTSFRGDQYCGRRSSEYSRKPHETVSDYIRQYRQNERSNEGNHRKMSGSRSPSRRRSNYGDSTNNVRDKRSHQRSKSEEMGVICKHPENKSHRKAEKRHRHDSRGHLPEECDITKKYENLKITRTFSNSGENSTSDILSKQAHELVKLVDTISKVIPLESLITSKQVKKSSKHPNTCDEAKSVIDVDSLSQPEREKSPEYLELAYEKISCKKVKTRRKHSDANLNCTQQPGEETSVGTEPEILNGVSSDLDKLAGTSRLIPASFFGDGTMKFETDSHMKCFEGVREIAFKQAIRFSDDNYAKYSKRKFVFEDELIQQLQRNYERYSCSNKESKCTMPRFASADLMTDSIVATWRDPHMVPSKDRQLREFDDIIGYVGFNIPCYWCELVFAEGKFLRAFPVLDPIGHRDDTMYCQTQQEAFLASSDAV